MEKIIKLVGLGCANCAAKMERSVGKIDGITSCSINFMSQKMFIEAPDDRIAEILVEAEKCIKKIESDVTFA